MKTIQNPGKTTQIPVNTTQDQEKYIGNIDLSKTEFQAIYASQLYGTFFMVFAKFTAIDKGEGVYSISKIKFKLVNYKGLINIGINKVQGIEKKTDLQNDEYCLIRLELQGLNANDEKELELSGFEMKKGDCLVIDRTTKKMHNGAPINHSVFDEEFFYRHGVEPNNNYKPRTPSPDADREIDVKGPDSICPRAMNYVV